MWNTRAADAASPAPQEDVVRDAARYRWLLQQEGFAIDRMWHDACFPHDIDAAIDAEIAALDAMGGESEA
jgi:hypothetical protein